MSKHTINESADKIRLKTKVRRGTGTRDRDDCEVLIKGDDPADAAHRLRAALDALAAEGIIQALRTAQPVEEAP